MPDETLLIEDQDTNITSPAIKTRGGRYQVTTWADAWDNAEIQIEIHEQSAETDKWFALFDTVNGTPKIFNQDEQAIIDIVAVGSELRAKMTGAGGSTDNVNCRIRPIT